MGLFSEKRQRRQVIRDHTYDDTALDAAVDALADGQRQAAITVLAECREQAEVRALRTDVLRHKLIGSGQALEQAARKNDIAELWLLAGATFIAEAWTVRGDGPDGTVGEQRFKMFFALLRRSIGPLNRAAELLPSDAVPWSFLQITGRGLRAARDQQDEIWREIVARCPILFHAHRARLRALAGASGGSDDEMVEFARGSVDTAPAGDPLTAMLPLAHFEVLRGTHPATGRRAQRLRRGLFAAARAEIDAAADKWMTGTQRPHPRDLEAHNLFAGAYVVLADRGRARRHLLGMRDRVHDVPWDYLGSGDQEYVRSATRFL